MANTSTVTLRIPSALKADLEALSRVSERSPSWLAARAVKAWVDENRWQLEAISDGLTQADRGDLVDHERVASWLDSWGTPGEGDPPR